jgi:YD repeat-containing protein
MVKSRTVRDKHNNIYSREVFEYDSREEIRETDEFHGVHFIFRKNHFIYHYDGTYFNCDKYQVQYAFYDTHGKVTNYDKYGNCTKMVDHGDIEIPGDESVTIVEYIIDETNNIMVPSQKRVIAVTLDGGLKNASVIKYSYDHQPYGRLNGKGVCTKIEEMVEPGKWVTAEYEYDAKGRLKKARDPLALEGEYTTREYTYSRYDNTRGAYYDSVTNALDMTAYVYYDDYMRPVEQVDANGISWFTAYDEYGRVVKTWGPEESESTPGVRIEYDDRPILTSNWDISEPASIHTITRDHTPDGFNTYTYIDGFGRTIQTKCESRDGKWTTMDSYYDNNGNNYKNSVPYQRPTHDYTSPLETAACVENEYDPVGRVKKTIHTDGNTSKAFYDHTKYMLVDAANHISMTETTGNRITETVYEGTYPGTDPLTRPDTPFYSRIITDIGCDGTRVTDHLGNTIVTRRDMLGRKESYSDPDLGEWTYEYDDAGRLIEQADAKGQTITLEYDRLGRLSCKKYDGVTNSVYFYDGLDETGNSDGGYHGPCEGRLTCVCFPKGHESYVYDGRGRIIRIRSHIDGRSRIITMTYDEADRIKTETLPTGEVLTYTYGEDGNLVSINGEESYATDIEYTAYGKLKQICYGNGITTTYSYYDDNTGDPSNDYRTHSYHLREILIEESGGTRIARTGYEYDGTGNLKKKTFEDDEGTYYSEEFRYDIFNRLESASSPELYGNLSYTYDSMNNTLTKEGRIYHYETEVDGTAAPCPTRSPVWRIPTGIPCLPMNTTKTGT